MSICIVACQMTMINPEDPFSTEYLLQTRLNLRLGHGLVAMGCQQTAGCGKYRPLAVALYRAPFQYEVQTVDIVAFQLPLVIEPAIDGVVEFCRELLAPAIKLEVEQSPSSLVIH